MLEIEVELTLASFMGIDSPSFSIDEIDDLLKIGDFDSRRPHFQNRFQTKALNLKNTSNSKQF